jgi:hypothetical protein
VAIALQPATAGADALVADFLHLLERNGLTIAAGGARAPEYRVHREGGQATHADRELVRDWSRRWTHAATVTIGDITDLEST